MDLIRDYKLVADSLTGSDAVNISAIITEIQYRLDMKLHIVRGMHECPFTGNLMMSNYYKLVVDGTEYIWPYNYSHYYVLTYKVRPPQEFIEALDKALSSPKYRFQKRFSSFRG